MATDDLTRNWATGPQTPPSPPQGREWIGKWVRFYRGDAIRIGVVQYYRKADALYQRDQLLTDIGCVPVDSVEEWR